MDANDMKEACSKLGITYKEMGDRIGVCNSAISNYVKGKRKISKPIEKLVRIELEKNGL